MIRWTDKVYLDSQGNIRNSDGCPTDNFINDENDMKIYMLGYLKGCEDTLKKLNELQQYSIPNRRTNKRGDEE